MRIIALVYGWGAKTDSLVETVADRVRVVEMPGRRAKATGAEAEIAAREDGTGGHSKVQFGEPLHGFIFKELATYIGAWFDGLTRLELWNCSNRSQIKMPMDFDAPPPPPAFQTCPFQPMQVNLLLNGGKNRWQAVINSDLPAAKELIGQVWGEILKGMTDCERCWNPVLAWIFGLRYVLAGGYFQEELKAWSEVTGMSFGRVVMANCAYELTQSDLAKKLHGGCTASILELGDDELVHIRNLDWPIDGLGKATRVFEFAAKGRKFIGVGFPGAVGLLSGMVPGAYSVTMNWAAAKAKPSWSHISPSYLLRKVLEECDTYQAAVDRLTSSRLCTSAFFVVCGAGKGEGCAIERQPASAHVRVLGGRMLVQTNHYDDSAGAAFDKFNEIVRELMESDFLVYTSWPRREAMEKSLALFAGKAWPGESALFNALDGGQVTNYQTCQRMIFRPRTGEYFLQTPR